MINLKKLFHFLGSIYFAITLIVCVALFVVAGTLIESVTTSHKYAALFTYGNPIFILLLWGFFINILVSALRRYPFKCHHIPFLITHLGLLMILGGTLLKSYVGVQGNMGIMEGSGSQKIFTPNTYVVHVESRGPEKIIEQYSIKQSLLGIFNPNLKDSSKESHHHGLEIKLLGFFPHTTQIYELWIKGKFGYIAGLSPMPVHEWDINNANNLLISAKARLQPAPSKIWNFYAYRTSDVMALAKKLFEQTLLMQIPSIAIIQDPQGDEHFFAFNESGQVHSESFSPKAMESLIVYDDGFGGYAAQTQIPFLQDVIIECPITCKFQQEIPQNKLEDNIPSITLELKKGDQVEILNLTYDRYGTGLKWPALNGEYVLRFQPRFDQIPYRIRLRDARQINYPNSAQAYSYESDILITDISSGTIIDKTISMNHVHETWNGYRFYLANIFPNQETSVQKIQIVVNYDPAKYILTYPGALLVSLGIILLFWFKR